MFQLVFRRRYSMAHRLISGISPKCSVPHGHNEYVEVSIIAKKEKPLDGNVNMVELFGRAKDRWHKFIDEKIDHSFQLSDKDPLLDFFLKNEPEKVKKIVVLPGDPTTEMRCACFMSKIQSILDEQNNGLVCQKVSIEETPTNTVVLEGAYAYKKYFSSDLSSHSKKWWERSDFSINDFSDEVLLKKPKNVGVDG